MDKKQEKNNWKKAIVRLDCTLRDVASNLTSTALKIALVVDSNEALMGTVSDGDIRRGLLRGLNLESSVVEVMRTNPFIVPYGLNKESIRQIMIINKIHQIPEVGEKKQVLNLHTWDELSVTNERINKIVIMAGGKGSRLMPYTDKCPKPMLKVSGKPMLQHIIENARNEGFKEFFLSVNYLSDIVEEYFRDGENLGVNIKYLKENIPLGTAGALSLLGEIDDDIIVTNGDIVSDIKYSDLMDFHQRHSSFATMAVRIYEWQNPYGVVKLSDLNIVGFEEKPIKKEYINAGVYALSPIFLNSLKKGEYCDMPSLFERIQSQNKKTIAYPMHEPWLDVGRPSDLIRANSGNS
jgi:dTDP-glucose pyrophosphorylase